jgi:hypothetical protein
MVMRMAITPSLNASNLPLPIFVDPPFLLARPIASHSKNNLA